jgi:hypothetical protein
MAIIAAIALSWLPTVLFIAFSANKDTESQAMAAAAMGAAVVIVAHLLSRQHAWTLILWVPLVLFAIVGSMVMLGQGLSLSTSGPSAGALEGVAVLMMLMIAASLGAMALVGGMLRPKAWSLAMLLIGTLNTLLMFVACSSGYRAATSQQIIIQLHDPSGAPLVGAAVTFERYGCGAEGKHVFDESGGPLYSNEAGLVNVPSRRGRYETNMKISKNGFRDLTVKMNMQLSDRDQTRGIVIATYESRAVASGAILATEPLHLPLYLSPSSDAPSSEVRRFSLYSKNDLSRTITPKSLDLETGKFTADLSGDLQLEYFSATQTRFRDQRLRVRGLNGVHVFLVEHPKPRMISELSYENTYTFAPKDGYHTEIVIENPGNSPGSAVYVRAADGRTHGLLNIEALGDAIDEVPRYSGTLLINTSGRHLEYASKPE